METKKTAPTEAVGRTIDGSQEAKKGNPGCRFAEEAMKEGLQDVPSVAHEVSSPSSSVIAWQRRLLPFMITMLVALAAVSLISNFYEVRVVQRHIEDTHQADLSPIWRMVEADGGVDSFAYARWRTITALESQAMENRYHQASATVMSRIYMIFLGFATGVMMALVGATFILGKLQESEARLGAGGVGWRLSLQSSSPGLVLATLGTILIVSTIWARADVDVTDAAVYLPAHTFELIPPPQSSAAKTGDSGKPAEQTKSNIIRKVLKEPRTTESNK